MIDEKRIDAYLGLHTQIVASLKNPNNHINWDILKKQEAFMESWATKTLYNHQIETVQKEFDEFIKSLINFHFLFIGFAVMRCALFNYKINLKAESKPKNNYPNIQHQSNFLLTVIHSYSMQSAEDEWKSREAKRQLKNTYEALLTVKQCLADCGLLMSEINKRTERVRYNFIVSVQTGARKKMIGHYGIIKAQMEAYATSFNLGEDMHINGLSAEFSTKNDVLITATKLKSPEEIDAYKKRERIYGDLSFAKNRDVCAIITSDYIKIKVAAKAIKSEKSINDLIEESKIKEAIKLALTTTKALKQNVNALTLLSARFNKLEVDNKKGLVSNADYYVNYVQITVALLYEIEVQNK